MHLQKNQVGSDTITRISTLPELSDYHDAPSILFIQNQLGYMSAIQDPILNLLEYVPEEYQMHDSQVVDYLAYCITNAEVKMPRKPNQSPISIRGGNSAFSMKCSENAQKVSIVRSFNNWCIHGTKL